MPGYFKKAINLSFFSIESEGLPIVLVLKYNVAVLESSFFFEEESEETSCVLLCCFLFVIFSSDMIIVVFGTMTLYLCFV